MSNEALKLELIEWLARLQDPDMLASIQHLKKVSEDEGTIWSQMTAEQKTSYERGIAQLDAGLGIDSKELWKRYGRDR
jgi:hypothetical protein